MGPGYSSSTDDISYAPTIPVIETDNNAKVQPRIVNDEMECPRQKDHGPIESRFQISSDINRIMRWRSLIIE
jgi:hypothetical protein